MFGAQNGSHGFLDHRIAWICSIDEGLKNYARLPNHKCIAKPLGGILVPVHHLVNNVGQSVDCCGAIGAMVCNDDALQVTRVTWHSTLDLEGVICSSSGLRP